MLVLRLLQNYTLQIGPNYSKIPKSGTTAQRNWRFFSYVSTEYGPDPDPTPVFFNPEVQRLLKCLTRADLSKVFRKRKFGNRTSEDPVYKFMTDEQLQEALAEAERRAEQILQMPPAVPVRKPISKVLSKDIALQGLEKHAHVFTDVTFGTKDKDRLIVIREPDGTLKEADWPVRDRMNQLYFPKTWRMHKMPRMFEGQYFENLLTRKEYVYILDRACAQFEPDNPDYQRVTSITYQYVNDHNGFDILRSTRHFGSMAFYLAWFKNIDNLLLEVIETAHIEDANSLLQLYEKMHQCNFKAEDGRGLDGVMQYIAQAAQKKGPLELAVQAYKNFEKQQRELQQGIKAAHGLV